MILINGTPRQIERQLDILQDPKEPPPFRPDFDYTGSIGGAAWECAEDVLSVGFWATTALLLAPLDAPEILPLRWGSGDTR